MKKTKKKTSRLLTVWTAALFIFIGNMNVGFGQTTYSHTFTSSQITATPQTISLSSLNWNFSSTGGSYYGYDVNKGQQLGSGSNPFSTMSLETSGIVGTVTEIKVTTSGASSVNATFGITIGGTAFGTNAAITATSNEYTFTGSASASGAIPISLNWSQSSSKALYVKKITITYELAPTCTAPTTQATIAAFSSITTNSMNLSWTSGNGTAGRIVVMKEASAVSGTPTSGTAYPANSAFGSGSTIATNEFVVYNGTGNSVSVSGLKCGTTYHVKVYEYNTTDVCYNTTSPASANATTLTPSITATPTSLTGLTYVLGAGPSSNQSYSLSASNLSPTSGNITVTPSGSNYEVSTDGTTFSTTVNVPYTSGTLAATTVYARLKAGLAVNASYTSSITNTYANNTSCAASASVALSGSVTAPTPSIVLNSSNPAVPAGNIATSTTNNLIYGFSLDVTIYQAVLSSVSITTAGTYIAANLTNLKCWYSADATFDTGDQLLSTKTASLGTGTHIFPSFTNKTIASGTTGYIFITSDVPCATIGNTIAVSAITTANLTFTSGNKSGTAFAGGTKTFVDGVVNNVTALNTTNCVSAGTTVNWTLPAGCYDEILVVATSGSYTSSSPTGNGSAYTANTTFGSGTTFDGGTVVYKGTGTSVSATGLTNNTNYTYKVFTRKGTIWSSGVSVNCTPTIAYCVPLYTTGCSSSDRITNFILESISNNSGTNCSSSPKGYSDYTTLSTDLTEGISYNSSINIGSGGAAGVSIWIDFNNNGVFETSENVGNSTSTYTSGSTGNVLAVTIPLGSSPGTHRMRVRHVYNTAGNIIDPCNSYSFGEVEDYTVNIIQSCTPTATITSFLPTSGPVATLVTITGTGFTGATVVQFGGINATTFTIVNSTTILAEVPAGIGANSLLTISDASSCPTISVGSFAIKNSSGTCSSFANYTDLFISEIYDSGSLNVWNIELYNPTPNPITLTGVYQIKRAGNISDPANYSRTIDLTGVVPANSVFTISAGDSPQTCGGVSFDFTAAGGGINAEDVIALFKNGSLVDVSEAPNERGYSLLRKISTGVTAPSSTYISGDWIINSTESCADMGVFILPSNAITIDSNPADITGCSLTMSVSSPTAGITYQWKFNNPASMTGWLDVNSTNIPLATIGGATSGTLTITGDVSAMMDFQFYCELSESGCSIFTNAAQFKITSRPVYRSVSTSNGNWSTVSNWEMSTDNVSYVAACSYPRSINSSEVIIQSGTRIVLDLTGASVVDVDRLTIENGGTLELLPNSKLTIFDSIVGSDLIINGTLYDRGNATNGLNLLGTASWSLGSNGTIVKSSESQVDIYRQKYQGGISNIPASANWIYRYNNDGNPIVGTDGFFYPSLSFENTTAGSYSWNNATSTAFQGSSSFATVKGNLNIGVTGTSPCQVYNVNNNIQPMLLLGNLQIASGSSLNTNISTDYGTGFELKGNLIVDGILQVVDAATEERVLRFTGTSNQTVSGTGTIDLYKITVNKGSGDVSLNRNLQAQNELVMTSGNILTNTSLLELGLSTSQKGTLNHTSGFVVGKMKRWFAGTNSGDASGLFPMGFNDGGLKNRNAKIEYTTAPTAGHLTVEYQGSTMGLTGIPITTANSGGAGFDVTTTEDQGYWKIDNQNLTDGVYTITCTGDGYQNITNLSKLTLLKRVGTGSWLCPGTHIAPSGSLTAPVVARSGLVGWSNFGFGGGIGNPLPVELTAFYVSCVEDKNETNVHWTTASEQNSALFVVEKSRDLVNWTLVSKVDAAGSSSQEIKYSSTDLNGSNGLFYYRLNQFDYNGVVKTYGPISVSCDNNFNALQVYPNPSNGSFTVEVEWTKEKTQAQIQLIDVTGKIVKVIDVTINPGTTQVEWNEEMLQAGIYTIRLKKIQGLKSIETDLKPIRLVITR
ncbi:MAG: GEVED domain-containing protein [Crocinitomicaceae bacterium]|nr:GEVED domain-containing protein [Crocinitomicaceae bacterium]